MTNYPPGVTTSDIDDEQERVSDQPPRCDKCETEPVAHHGFICDACLGHYRHGDWPSNPNSSSYCNVPW